MENKKSNWREELKKRYRKLEKTLSYNCGHDEKDMNQMEEEMDTIDHVIFCTGDFYDAVASCMKENGIHEVVDIGCANGHQAEVFLQNGLSYTGVECCTYLDMWKPEQVTYLFGVYPFSIGEKRRLGCSNLCYGYLVHDYKALAEQFDEVILGNIQDKNEIEKYFTIHEMMEEAFYPEERSRTIYLLKNKNGWCAEPAPQV